MTLPDPDEATGGYEIIRHHVGLSFPDGAIVRVICDNRNTVLEAWLIRGGQRVRQLTSEEGQLYLERADDFVDGTAWATEP